MYVFSDYGAGVDVNVWYGETLLANLVWWFLHLMIESQDDHFHVTNWSAIRLFRIDGK